MFTNDTYPEPHVDMTFKNESDLPLQQGRFDWRSWAARRELQPDGGSAAVAECELPECSLTPWWPGIWRTITRTPGLRAAGRTVQPTPTLDSWRTSSTRSKASGATEVLGGRGPAAPMAQAVDEEKAYLHDVQGLVARDADAHGAAEVTGDAAQHDKAIADQVAAAFPAYQDPFMLD